MHYVLRTLAILVLVVSLQACTTRLDGPIHSADGPPWTRPDAVSPVPALDAQHHRVVLIGDTGLFLEDDPTLVALGDWTRDVPSSVVFLGDNLYNEGLQDDDRERGEMILRRQLEATGSAKIFIPGNHDWGLIPEDARAVSNQEAFIDAWPDGTARFEPKNGCIGPSAVVLHDSPGAEPDVVLVALDPTTWLMPGIENLESACPEPLDKDAYAADLDALLAEHADDLVVVGSHYPLNTGGPHGGLTYGMPAQLIIDAVVLILGGAGNTYEPAYKEWIDATEAVLRRHRPLAYAAGHDHSLQVLDGRGVAGIEVVSGAGAPERVSTVTNIPATLFAHAHPGFMVLDIGTRAGETVAVLRVIENGKTAPVFELEIPQ